MAAAKDLNSLVTSLSKRVTFTHLDKILYPDMGLTKASLLAYYAVVADWLLPHLAGRPLTLVRCPDGAARQCFFQKHAKAGDSKTLRRIPIAEDGGHVDDYMVVDDRDGLLAAVQLGSLELHVWGSHADRVEKPDLLVFDLDPDPAVPWSAVADAASEIREFLAELDLASWVKTTGGKGLHVVVPIERRVEWEGAKGFAKAASTVFASRAPSRFTVNPLKARRKGKIFIDYLRNGRGATAIAPYSTRARAGAPVATPITWAELERGATPADFDVTTVPQRLSELSEDPWAGVLHARQRISAAMLREVTSTGKPMRRAG